MRILWYINTSSDPRGLSSTGQVHCVTKQTISGHPLPYHPRHHLSRMDTDCDLYNIVMLSMCLITYMSKKSRPVNMSPVSYYHSVTYWRFYVSEMKRHLWRNNVVEQSSKMILEKKGASDFKRNELMGMPAAPSPTPSLLNDESLFQFWVFSPW